jgi:hypothetical protein
MEGTVKMLRSTRAGIARICRGLASASTAAGVISLFAFAGSQIASRVNSGYWPHYLVRWAAMDVGVQMPQVRGSWVQDIIVYIFASDLYVFMVEMEFLAGIMFFVIAMLVGWRSRKPSAEHSIERNRYSGRYGPHHLRKPHNR